MKEASRFGIMSTDKTGRITKFAEKPAQPESNLASMGIYVFDWEFLREYLEEDAKKKIQAMTLVKILFRKCLQTMHASILTLLKAIGKMLEQLTAFGKLTWTF